MNFEIFFEILRSSSPISANNDAFQSCIKVEEKKIWQISALWEK